MVFNSIAFLLFLPIVLFGFYVIPHKVRWVWLLMSGFVFYGWWKWEYLGLLLLSSAIDYTISNKIATSNLDQVKKRWLWLSIACNLGILIIFKYLGAFIMTFPNINHYLFTYPNLGTVTHFLNAALPVGISFYTFQTMSYTIDVYRGHAQPAKHFGKFLLFVSYFPQLVAGPIERYNSLNPQLTKQVNFQYDNFQAGFRFIIWGFFVKMVVADNLAAWVDTIFLNPYRWHPLVGVFGMVCFSLQIYADFHGYTLIAKGVAKLFGVHLMDNFNRPYLAKSINEFWKRWHISLTTWFRDYLYIPLGGNKSNSAAWLANILAVFLISGLWHGAKYTFIIWGAIHGIFYLVERKFSRHYHYQPKIKWAAQFLTFALVTLSWVFFRAPNLEIAKGIFITTFGLGSGIDFLTIPWHLALLVVLFFILDHGVFKKNIEITLAQWNWQKRWLLYSFIIVCIINFSGATSHPFIYFRF